MRGDDSDGRNKFPTYTIQINDTKPIWYYCSQGPHCQEGMVGVINAPKDKTLSTYIAAAKGATANVSPSTGPLGGVKGTSSTSNAKDPGTAGSSSGSGSVSRTVATPSATGAAGRGQVGGWVLAAAMGVAAAVV